MARTRLVVAALTVLLAVGCRADDWEPSHHCSKPFKPYALTSSYELERFKHDVEDYEQCIDEFVRKQKEAVHNHQEAARRAINEWNTFVRIELR